MRLNKISAVLLPIGVLVLTGEILWRRLIVGQIPTQFSAFLVYGLIIVNVIYLGYEGSKLVKMKKDAP